MQRCSRTGGVTNCPGFKGRLPFRILVIHGAEFQSRFHWHLESLDIRHVYIRPKTPHLNGKVERSHRGR
jgi:transposase InsO family protein